MQICFLVGSVYQLFITYVLSKTKYKKKHKIVLVTGELITEKMVLTMRNTEIWDDVIVLNNGISDYDRMKEHVYSKVDVQNISTLHYFSFGFRSFNVVYSILCGKAKIILTEEGTLSYSFIDKYNKWCEFNDVNIFREYLDFDYIDELWLLDPKLHHDSMVKPIKKIELKKYMDKLNFSISLIRDMRKIFDYHDEVKSPDAILFDQPMNLITYCSYDAEQFMLKNIVESFEGLDLLFKMHPGERYQDKYKNFDVRTISGTKIPWEVLLLEMYSNKKLKNTQVYLTYDSTSVFNSKILLSEFGVKINVVFLNRILSRYSFINTSEITLIKKFKEVYGVEDIFEPDSFTELQNIINNQFNSKDYTISISDMFHNEKDIELEWLREQYRKTWRNLPSEIAISFMYFDTGNGFEGRTAIRQFVKTSDRKISLKYTVPSNLNKMIRMVRWDPIENRLCTVKINRIMLRYSNGKVQQVGFRNISHNASGVKKGRFQFLTFDPQFSFEVREGLEEVHIEGEWEFLHRYDEVMGRVNDNYIMRHKGLVPSKLYIDFGSGYNEMDSVKGNLVVKRERFRVSFFVNDRRMIKGVRWDPVEGEICNCAINSANADSKHINFTAINAIDNSSPVQEFLTVDPMYEAKGNFNGIREVNITGTIQFLNSYELENRMNNLSVKRYLKLRLKANCVKVRSVLRSYLNGR